MGQAKIKEALRQAGQAYIAVEDMKGLSFPVTETPEGDLLVTDGPYKGMKVRQLAPKATA